MKATSPRARRRSSVKNGIMLCLNHLARKAEAAFEERIRIFEPRGECVDRLMADAVGQPAAKKLPVNPVPPPRDAHGCVCSPQKGANDFRQHRKGGAGPRARPALAHK